MEIETQELTTCEVAADGCAISLGFVDSRGEPATIRLSVNQVGVSPRRVVLAVSDGTCAVPQTPIPFRLALA